MAQTLGEKVGDTVGIRTRLDTRISARTRIEVVTEGVFTRAILDDPSLDGISAVLFDEFHERSLDADFGLALALDAQRGLRDDLRLLVMSATLDDQRIAGHLGDAPLIRSDGRAYPVETRYLGRGDGAPIVDRMTQAILTARGAETGSILAFLPGQGEILRVAERLRERLGQHEKIDVCPLYGALDARAQDQAISPAEPGRRKIVLATSVAETSITIEGVRVVVDCGQARIPRYEPGANVTRLETVRVSRAAADQRRGRAGRTEPGVCYRLWDEPETQALKAFADPEIMAADLSGLALDCIAWGVSDPAALPFLDPPPKASWQAAIAMLENLGAVRDNRLTDLGQRLRRLPLPAPIARMILDAGSIDNAHRAVEIAGVLVERGLGGNDTDIKSRVERFRRESGNRKDQMQRQMWNWIKLAGKLDEAPSGPRSTGELLALAFPDRIGKARGAPGHFVLA
ncbi:MAG: ATP-dependent helicase HrpB, partial [Pseudomonadota bacterium]